MKAAVIQTEYSYNFADSDRLFARTMALMDACDPSMDIIVLPEYSDLPALAETRQEMLAAYEKYNRPLLEKAAETARRCGAMLFINALHDAGNGLRNTTHAFNRKGEIAGYYYKQHPVNAEVFGYGLDSEYSYLPEAPTVIEMEGIRFGFLTCYDFYFYENYAHIARQNVDVIIGCALQRSDLHSALEMMSRFCAYNCNAWVLRSSTSLGKDSPVGGSSMIVSPRGEVLADMHNDVGICTVDFDPHDKYFKPAGFGNPPSAHHDYIEIGRRPWKYRPAGSAVIRPDALLPYPRICAHRGFSTIAPENSMPAFGAAVALGAQEIEFDLWPTADGEIVSLHDSHLDRVSTGSGPIWEHTLAQLNTLDFGVKFSEKFTGLPVVTFEDILKKFSCQVIMNIHVKSTRSPGKDYDDRIVEKIAALIRRYDCAGHCYIMSENNEIQRQFARLAPELSRCMGENGEHFRIVDRAIEFGCKKVQLFKPYFNQEMIDKAHEHGIICNVFWSDDPEEAKSFLKMGIDVILTNDYQRVCGILK